MLTSFWAGLGSSLAERWSAAALTPAFLFWAAGLTAGAWGPGGVAGWRAAQHRLTEGSDTTAVLLLVAALVVVTLSAVAVNRLTLTALRFLEGYWPRPFVPLERLFRARQCRRFLHHDRRFQQLAPRIANRTATSQERREYAAADRALRRFPGEPTPADPERLMPTRLGNVLRAAETRPLDKYGLDPAKCWSRLWLVLPQETKKTVTEARVSVDSAATVWTWGLLTLVWSPWGWWVPLAGITVSGIAYVWLLGRAETFGELIESAFDVHRWQLYDALHWPLPENPAAEHAAGTALTSYLWWGSDEPSPTFRPGGPP
ncbi:hypothetical protein GCM10009665_58840 [Kitasatospora nipponensis]|uniref:Vegetative cell wall protein gp1 n=1 Tax=Kitasatospora nipponensis TaxID=258049 RepID=A0ABN1WTG3_9ACTN